MSVLSRSLSVVLGVGLSLVALPAAAAAWSCTSNIINNATGEGTMTCLFEDGGPAAAAFVPAECQISTDLAGKWDGILDGSSFGGSFAPVASAVAGQVRWRFDTSHVFAFKDACTMLKQQLSEVVPMSYFGDSEDSLHTRLTDWIDRKIEGRYSAAASDGYSWIRWQPADGSAGMWLGIFAMQQVGISPAALTFINSSDVTADITVLGLSIWFKDGATRANFNSCMDYIRNNPSTWSTSDVCTTSFDRSSVRLPDGITYRVGGKVLTWSSSTVEDASRPRWERVNSPWSFDAPEGVAIIDPCGLAPGEVGSCAKSTAAFRAIETWGAGKYGKRRFVLGTSTTTTTP